MSRQEELEELRSRLVFRVEQMHVARVQLTPLDIKSVDLLERDELVILLDLCSESIDLAKKILEN